METANYNYTIEQSGDSSIITYKKTPISYKAIVPMIVIGFFPACILTYLMASYDDTVTSVFTKFGISMFIVCIGTVFVINLFRKKGEIIVNKNSILVDGKTYDRNHIKSVFIRTPKGEEVTTSVIVRHSPLSLGGNVANLQGSMGQLSNESGNAFRRHLKNGAYRINMRFGAKDVTLAKHLSEIHAEVLYDKILEVLEVKS
ncbi:MAG: hypothetical protein V4663_14640 [Bacteroidota bacterium]